MGANQFGVGAAGGASALFTDMLRENILFTGFQLQGRLIDAGGQVSYFNQARRLNCGVGFSHFPQVGMGAAQVQDELNGNEVINLQLFEDRCSRLRSACLIIIPFL